LLFDDQEIDFAAAMNHQIFARVIAKGLRRPRQFQPAASILFTDRAQTGHYTNIKDMKARFNMHRIYRDYLALPQLGDPGFEERMRRVPKRPEV